MAGRSINRVREHRESLGLSQAEFADRADVSRSAVSAIEAGRLAPNVHAALRVAAALGVSVESLFGGSSGSDPAWVSPPTDGRFWQARVGGRTVLHPVETGPGESLPHDGVATSAGSPPSVAAPPTLVVAGCDPAAGLMAAEFARETGNRLLPLARSSTTALDLLGRGVMHAAGVHLGDNAAFVRSRLGLGHRLLRVARWEAGVAFGRGLEPSARAARAGRRWVSREPGSGARQCQDEFLAGRPAPRRVAGSHRSVAEAVRSGWADLGVCTRLTASEAGLGFLPVRKEAYDLVVPEPLLDDPLVRSLVDLIRSSRFRRIVAELPGYDTCGTGDMHAA